MRVVLIISEYWHDVDECTLFRSTSTVILVLSDYVIHGDPTGNFNNFHNHVSSHKLMLYNYHPGAYRVAKIRESGMLPRFVDNRIAQE